MDKSTQSCIKTSKDSKSLNFLYFLIGIVALLFLLLLIFKIFYNTLRTACKHYLKKKDIKKYEN